MSLRSGYRLHYGRQVRVYTKDDRTLRGILVHHYRDVVCLHNAGFIRGANDKGEEIVDELPGEAVIPRDQISFIQVVP